MSRKQINLSVIEDKPSRIPEDVERIGQDALQIFWQTSLDIAEKEIEAAKKHYQLHETEIKEQRKVALEKAEQASKKLAAANAIIETVTRENKSLQVDINNKNDELKIAVSRNTLCEETITEHEHEIKRLTEEVGRSHESADNLTKRLYEVNRRFERETIALKESREEATVNLRIRERVDKDLKVAIRESKEVWELLKTEQRRTAVAEALVQEKMEVVRNLEASIKLLKQEKYEIKETLEGEAKIRLEMEKRVVAITARTDSMEAGHKETILKQDKELKTARSEVTSLRNRMIKTEGAFEREKKALERLETKLVAASKS